MSPQPARNRTVFPELSTAVAAPAQLVATRNDPLNRMAFYLGLGTIFMQFGVLPQVTTYLLHFNLYLPYLIAMPAILAMIVSGGLRSAFRARPAYYWIAFGCWMWVASPFSIWPGASVEASYTYWRSNLVMLFIVAQVVQEWSDVRKVMNVIALSGVINVLSGRLTRADVGERMGVALGSIGNPNDYAAHLILVLPFLLWVLMQGKIVSRVVALAAIAGGLYLILATSSRGAVMALGADMVFWAIMGTGRQKFALVLVAPVAVVILVATAPAQSLRRLTSIWESSATSAEAAEAMQSSIAREYTLNTSIRYTVEHPLFGVGPEEFALYEGGHEKVIGTHGYWHDTHNSFTQASSECGVPGLIFFAGGIVSTILLLLKTLKQARKRPDCKDIRLGVFCVSLGMIGFTVAVTFLSFAYFFYFPAMAGLAIGVWTAAQREFQLRDAAAAATPA